MRSAKQAVRDLPTHVLMDLADIGTIQHPPTENCALGSVRTPELSEAGHTDGWRSILSWATRWLHRLFGRAIEQQKGPVTRQQSGLGISSNGATHRETFDSEGDSRHEALRREQARDQVQETPTGPSVEKRLSAQEYLADFRNRDTAKKLRRRVSAFIGQAIVGKITLETITDELARRGVTYRQPIEGSTLVIRDCDLIEAEIDGHRLLRSGLERVLRTGDYVKISIETSKPVRICEPLRRDVELRSWAPLSIPELQITSASLPKLSVDHRASVENLEAVSVKCGILEATSVKVTELNVKGDARATHVDVCHDMVIEGTLDNVSHIRVVGRAVIGSLGSNFSQNACVSGGALAKEIAKKASLSFYSNGQTLTELVARAEPIHRRVTPESVVAQNAADIPASTDQRHQEVDEGDKPRRRIRRGGVRI
jgi:hypothetical protein